MQLNTDSDAMYNGWRHYYRAKRSGAPYCQAKSVRPSVTLSYRDHIG